jgi:putative transposase
MVRYQRQYIPGGSYFFTVTLADRRSTALTDHISALRAAFRAVKAESPFTIDAIVILPDHLHALFTLPENDANYSDRWRRIKANFTKSLVASGAPLVPDARGEYRLWQRQFWEHTIRNENDLARHVDYIHINPVKHGLVDRVADWPFSSFHHYVRNGLIPPSWAGAPPSDAPPTSEPSKPTQRSRSLGETQEPNHKT